MTTLQIGDYVFADGITSPCRIEAANRFGVYTLRTVHGAVVQRVGSAIHIIDSEDANMLPAIYHDPETYCL